MSIRDEFETWWEINYHNGKPPRFGWAAWRDGDGYKIDDDESELDGMWNAWQAATNALEAKCAALAAELNAVEAIHDDAVFITDDHYEQCPPEVQEIIRSLAVMQIPAYKAFLAEVRAQGVEMLREHPAIQLCSLTHVCDELASQLRQEAQ